MFVCCMLVTIVLLLLFDLLVFWDTWVWACFDVGVLLGGWFSIVALLVLVAVVGCFGWLIVLCDSYFVVLVCWLD